MNKEAVDLDNGATELEMHFTEPILLMTPNCCSECARPAATGQSETEKSRFYFEIQGTEANDKLINSAIAALFIYFQQIELQLNGTVPVQNRIKSFIPTPSPTQ